MPAIIAYSVLMSEVWETAKTLRYHGVKYSKVADATGLTVSAIKARALRERWADQFQALQLAVKQAGKDSTLPSLETQSQIVRDALASDLVKAVASLPEHSKLTRKTLERNNAIAGFIANAKELFGWQDNRQSGGASIVNVQVLAQAQKKHAFHEDTPSEKAPPPPPFATAPVGENPSARSGVKSEGSSQVVDVELDDSHGVKTGDVYSEADESLDELLETFGVGE